MARHALPGSKRRTLLGAGLTVSMAGAALGLGGSAAQADQISVPHALAGTLGPLKALQVDPLANTGVDPLDNGVGTSIGDFKPISTKAVTDTVTKGAKIGELPGVALLSPLLPG